MHYIFWLFTVFVCISDAHAYIGPGPGLAMLGPLLGLIGGVLLALAMVLAYPIRLFIKRRKASKK
jgi:hypothetical protein